MSTRSIVLNVLGATAVTLAVAVAMKVVSGGGVPPWLTIATGALIGILWPLPRRKQATDEDQP